MQILRSIDALAEIDKPVVLAAGVFDGIHLGHRAVLQSALDAAQRVEGEAIALTFVPHPATILRPESAPRLLTSPEFKLRHLETLGFKHALLVTFDAEFAAIEPEDFVLQLCRAARQLSGICVGEGWGFGSGRRGDCRMLRHFGQIHGFFTTGVAPVRVGGEIVSSTIIREALAAGDIAKAARFLGRSYSVSGPIHRGRGMGRSLGFPTANLPNQGEQYPLDGVYAVRTLLEGVPHEGVANIGFRPTVGESSERLLEVHLFDFDRDFYGAQMEVTFAHFLRPEKKFPSLDALRVGIAQDAAMARAWFGNSPMHP